MLRGREQGAGQDSRVNHACWFIVDTKTGANARSFSFRMFAIYVHVDLTASNTFISQVYVIIEFPITIFENVL